MRHPRTPTPAARGGFTLVELLVAAALTVVVMYVLAAAFQAATDTLSQLKSVAGLADQLRTAEASLVRDLSGQHLEDDFDNKVYVSQLNNATFKKKDGTTRYPAPWAGPQRGFFKVVQESVPVTTAGAPYLNEGADGDSVPSFRATDHWMHFTTRLPADTTANVFLGLAPGAFTAPGGGSLVDFNATAGGSFVGRWAEVAYFLEPTSVVSAPDVYGVTLPLSTLYRRQAVMAPPGLNIGVDPTGPPPAAPDTSLQLTKWQDKELSIRVGKSTSPNAPPDQMWGLNTPDSVIVAGNRVGAGSKPTPMTGTSQGLDVLLSNVVSFQIQVMTDGTTTFADPSPATYDTATATATSPTIRAIQIKLRVYDTKNKVTRQVTINQPL